MSGRTIDEIRATGAAWITEAELERLCALAARPAATDAAQTIREEDIRWDVIIAALDLAIQAWRTVPSARDRIIDAIAEVGHAREALAARPVATDTAREALSVCVRESYNLMTQGESPTQRRQPSARRIYEAASAALQSLDARFAADYRTADPPNRDPAP